MNPIEQIKEIAEKQGFSISVAKKIPEILEIEFIELHRQKKEIEKKLTEAKSKILKLHTPNEPAQGESINIIFVKPTKILDMEKLKNDYPELFEKYSKEKKGFYQIKIKGEEK